ncbi:MAG TPA: helix-turn-helix transcriptional regulator, partial [Gemmatimonadaceae bacterium]|nr:helix-turn-helix transcriptional regulator [Gemmatimonadaceae bacterium]
ASHLTERAEQVLRSLTTGTSARERVRSEIWNVLSEGPPNLSRIASALSVTPRTLQRRLAEEGTSLQREVEEIRRMMAMALLRDSSNSIDEVAMLLGYAEPSTLFRSFRRWTGMTPYQYRETPVS